MSDPVFIEEIEPEAMVTLTVVFRGQDETLLLTAPSSQAAELLAAHSSRDPSARHQMWLLHHFQGVTSLDLDEVCGINVRVSRAQQVGSLWKKVEELSN